MRTLLALLLTTTAALGQSGGVGAGLGLHIDPLGALVMLTGNSVSGQQGTVTARFIVENISGRPLEIAVDGDAPASIGSCNGGTSIYSGITAGFDPARHPTPPNSGSPTLKQALHPLPAGEKVSAAMQVKDCRLAGQSVVALTVPVFVVDHVRGSATYSLTVPDVPFLPD